MSLLSWGWSAAFPFSAVWCGGLVVSSHPCNMHLSCTRIWMYSPAHTHTVPPPPQAWVLPALQFPDRAFLYYTYAAVYCAPLFMRGFDMDSWSWLMFCLCVVHVQVGLSNTVAVNINHLASRCSSSNCLPVCRSSGLHAPRPRCLESCNPSAAWL